MINSPILVVLSAVTTVALFVLPATSVESLAEAGSSQRTVRRRQDGGDDQPQRQRTCHLRELDLCLASLTVFFQHNQHQISHSEINRQCKILLETEKCLSNYTSRCMTDRQAQVVDMFADGGLDTIRELCKPTSKLHSNYLKYGDCINGQHEAPRVCMRDFQVSLEKAVYIDWQDRLKLGCCAYNKLNACVRDVIEPKCGSEAYEMYGQIMRSSISRLPSVTCARYEHSGKVCSELLPPAGSTPKGSKSHSVLSRLFSAYTGQ